MDYYYYDDQDSDNELDQTEDYEYDSVILGEETFTDLYKGCIKASTVQIQQYVWILLGCCVAHRLIWALLKRLWRTPVLYHVASIGCGLLSLWLYVGPSTIYVVSHSIHTCLFLRFLLALPTRQKGLILSAYTIGCQLIAECFMGEESYETIRGPQMVVSMKFISVAFDIQDAKESFNWIALAGYVCSPTSIILGPWNSYRDYKQVISSTANKLQIVLKVVLNMFLSVLFLNLSNCIIPWIKHLWNAGLLYRTYLDALSVRCSHYFICFLSHSTYLTSFQRKDSVPAPNMQAIVKPFAIEFPRSLSVVIRSWNLPMHFWLKHYIFQRLRSARVPHFAAMSLTFLVSCLVHGFNYKVHLVLMSLLVFSYFETSLRRTLSHIFNACLESTACQKACKYRYCARLRQMDAGIHLTYGRIFVCLVNFMFSLIVMAQLAYLGVMLNSTSSLSTSLTELLHVWSHMKYFGHWIAVAMALFYVAI